MRTKKTYTPGPRIVHQGEDYIVVMGGNLDNTDNPIGRFARIEDANLDAAAPDLLEALIADAKHVHSFFECGDDGKSCPVEAFKRAAIAKADGR